MYNRGEFLTLILPPTLTLILCLLLIFSADGVKEDDSFIFFQYARNLATGNGLSFNPGELSFGVTSILWTLIIALVGVFTREFVVSSQIVAALLTAGTVLFWIMIIRGESKNNLTTLLFGLSLGGITLFLIFPNVDAMDGPLVGFLYSLVSYLALTKKNLHPFIWGILGGVCYLARPELLILGLLVLFLIIKERLSTEGASKTVSIVKVGLFYLIGFLLISSPWLLALRFHTGSWTPPTMTGKLLYFLPQNLNITLKQFQELSILDRLSIGFSEIYEIFLHPPGARMDLVLRTFPIVTFLAIFPVALILAKKELTVGFWGIQISFFILILLTYAAFFPLVKPRYFINYAPVSLASCFLLAKLMVCKTGIATVGNKTFLAGAIKILLVLLLVSVGIRTGTVSYSAHCKIVKWQNIRKELGLWFKNNTDRSALIALEPIGAVGFYSERRILDMGGIVKTDIWPYLREGVSNTQLIFAYLNEKKPTYLVDYLENRALGRTATAYPDCFSRVASVNPIGYGLDNLELCSAYLIYRFHCAQTDGKVEGNLMQTAGRRDRQLPVAED